MRKLLTGGTVVTGQASIKADILIEDEKILAIGSTTELAQKFPEKAETIDVAGCLLFPGFIDAHTHFDLQVAGTVTADDFASGTKACPVWRHYYHFGFCNSVQGRNLASRYQQLAG